MELINNICFFISDIFVFIATTSAFLYGVKYFLKEKKALYLQLVALAMGCYAMGSFYHIFQNITSDIVIEGFTPAYLGKMGFFLFLFTANYGQIDSLLDDGTAAFKKYRKIAFVAPAVVIVLYLPCAITPMPLATKIAMLLVWICAIFSSYFNFKHAIISDLGYGFAKSIRPYNICAIILTFLELLVLLFWANYDLPYGFILIAVASLLFSIMCFVTVILLKKGVEAWTT